jgi:hypothetical protein
MGALTCQRASISSCHGNMHAGVLQKDAIVGIKLTQLFLIDPPWLLSLLSVTLGSVLGLFCRVSCRTASPRGIRDVLGVL